MAVQDPEPQQQPPQQQPVKQLLKAAAAGQAAKTVAGGAIVAPAVAVTLPARAAVGAVAVPAEAFVHGVKIAIILRVLRKLLRWHTTDSTDWLTKQLMAMFPDADPAVIRAAVENEMKLERLFQEKAIKRVTAALTAAGELPTLEQQQAKVQAILKLEQHYADLREKVMLQRAKAHVENAQTKDRSPEGARWNLGPAKNHTLGCLALAGKTWPWSVLDAIQPPLHPGCQCYLTPLAPGDPTPPQGGDAINAAKAALALEEAIREIADPGELEAFLDGQEIRPTIARALIQLQEMGWKDWLHPRGRGGEWIKKLEGEVEKQPNLFDFHDHSAPNPPHVADKPYVPKADPHMPDLSPGSTVVSGAKSTADTVIGGDVPEPAQQGPIPDFGHIPLKLQLPPAFGSDSIKARGQGEDYIVKDHGGDHARVASELLSNAVYRELGIDTPTMGHVRTAPEPDFSKRADDLKDEPPIDANPGARISTGIILREPDGRVTLIEPRNHYGGYIHTFPKGGVEPNLTPQQNAHKELWEETGLHARITGVVGDFKGDTGTSRFYLGVRTGGEPTPSDETQAIKTVTPDEAAKMLNKPRDQEVLKKLLEQPIPKKGNLKDKFPPEQPGSALAFKALPGTKATGPSGRLGDGYMADALLANRDTQGGLRWQGDNPIRTSMASTLGYGKGGGDLHAFTDTPSEVWKMRYRGGVPQSEDALRAQARHIANTLTDAKIEELTKAAPYASEADRKLTADALKGRVAWMRRFANGEEELPQPVSGQEARTMFADAQDGFDIYPEEQQAIEGYGQAAGRTLDDHLRSGKDFTDTERQTVKRLDAVLGATKTPEDAHVYMGADAAPTQEMVGKTFSMKSYIRAHSEMANTVGNSRVRLLVPSGGRMLHQEDAPQGQPDMLVPRDQRMQITGLRTDPDGKKTLDAVLLPYQNPKALPSAYKPPAQTGFTQHYSSTAKTIFKKGDRVDVNGNKATVTGDAGKGMANVKLDSGKGYTVPFSILKKLEEAASVADFKDWLHPRGRGGEWIQSGRHVTTAVNQATAAIKDVTKPPPRAESIARIEKLGVEVVPPGKGSKMSDQEIADIAGALEDAFKQYPILKNGPGAPLTKIAFASHQKFGKKMKPGVLADTGIRQVSHKESGWKPESVITFNDRYGYNLKPSGPPPPNAAIGGQLSVSSRSWAGVTWHELGHAMMNGIDMAGHHDSKRYVDWMSRYGIGFEDCKGISTYAVASRSEGIAEMCSMENTPGFNKLLPPDLQPKVAKMFSDLRNWPLDKPYVYQKPLPGSTPSKPKPPKTKAPTKPKTGAKMPANLADIEAKVKANPGTAGPKMPVADLHLTPGDVFEGGTPGLRYLTISDSTAKGGLSYVPLNQGKTKVYQFSSTSKRRKVNLSFPLEESAVTLDLSPEAVAKAEAAARENLAAGDWVAPDPFLDDDEPVEEAVYTEALHPRGRGGKWERKLGVPKASAIPKLSTPEDRIVSSLKGKTGDEGYQALARGEALDTQHIHQVDGKYTEARQLQHQAIIDHFFKDAKPAKGKAKAIFTAGGAASGKSTLAGQSSHTEANLDIPKGAVYINPDDIKEMLPEYKKLKAMGREDVAAAAVHEESSDLAKLMTRMAMNQNYPIIVDGTGDSKVGKFGDKLRAAQNAGYDVEARYAHVPVSEALTREKDRAKRTGRKVAESLLREQHQTVAKSYVEDVSKIPDVHVKVYSTVKRGKPTLIAEKPPGKDSKVKVLDRKQYNEHIAKANP